MNLQNTFLICTLLCAPVFSFSQERVQKWGIIPKSDLQMTVYQPDSNASVVVLQDVGNIVLKANGYVTFYRSRRIKVLDETAFEQGNLMVTYRGSKRVDELRDLDVQVTTPDGITKKVKSDDVFTEQLAPGFLAKKIFIPELKKGSVIEYRYEMRSRDVLTLYDWYFQEDIPIRWSEVQITIPEYYDYIFLRNIPHAFDVQETSKGAQSGGYIGYINRWGLANMPALKEEPFTTSADDYRSFIKFQLRTVFVPGEQPQTIISNWVELAQELEDHDSFGVQYKKSGKFQKLWAVYNTLITPADAPEVKAAKALQFVSNNMKWDGRYRMFSEKDIDDAFENKSGNSADLNLAVVALLRKAGLTAYPMVLSTRSNGKMYPEYPFLAQFNSVVAVLQNGEKVTMLDATDPFLAINELNSSHYHGAAWMVNGSASQWVQIVAPESSETWYGKMKLNEEGEMSGSFQIQASGSIASDWRGKLNTAKQTEFLQKEFASKFPDIQLDSITVSNEEALDQPLSVKFKCSVPSAASVVNDFIYCQPVLDFFVIESPFKSLSRSFPVEFTTPFKAQYILDLIIPEAYTIEELPEPARVTLTDNGGKMSFNCSKNAAGAIQIILKMNISKTGFEPEEYGALRQFFEIVVEKTQFQMVLKKI